MHQIAKIHHCETSILGGNGIGVKLRHAHRMSVNLCKGITFGCKSLLVGIEGGGAARLGVLRVRLEQDVQRHVLSRLKSDSFAL
jgi:hypothetical protein